LYKLPEKTLRFPALPFLMAKRKICSIRAIWE